jgi:hypothetical protein
MVSLLYATEVVYCIYESRVYMIVVYTVLYVK